MKIKLSLLALLLAAGCVAAPVAQYNPKASSAGSASLARTLIDKDTISFHEGLKGVIILASGKQPDMSYKACITYTSQKGIIPSPWAVKFTDKSPLTRGMLAHMLVRVLGIRGGITMRIMDTSPRYALRECQDLKIIQKGSQDSPVSGREFLSILRNAEEYARENLTEG